MIIAGNKSDRNLDRQIIKTEAEQYCLRIGAQHIETSAKTGIGVHELFFRLTKEIYTKEEKKTGFGNKRRKKKTLKIERESLSESRT
jgi:GTPase SAR1 family protein